MKTQQNTVLALLQEAGSIGVNSYDLTYKFSIKQAPTRILELKELGYSIVSERKLNRSVQYRLLGKSQASQVTTEPQKTYVNSWEIPMESYLGKDGRTYWREIVEPKQESLI